MKQDGIKRASIEKLKSRFETAYYSEDMIITPLVMFRELDDLTALIQGVSIGVTVSGTAKIKINGKMHELRPNTLFIFNENTVIEQVKASIRSSGYMITYSQQYLNSIHVDTQDLISIYHGRKKKASEGCSRGCWDRCGMPFRSSRCLADALMIE